LTAAQVPLLWDQGIHLPTYGLWLDPTQVRPRAVISHAHSDHVANHAFAYCTAETQRLVTHRRAMTGRLQALPYRERVDVGGAWLSLWPAGHVLGSAQTLIETDFGRLLYTGDLKTRTGLTAQPAEPVPADVLVLESTFGRPRYRFPDSAEVVDAVIRWCRRTLADGATPVVFGYALGKGQEILSALWTEGFAIALHPTLFGVTEVYRECGQVFPPYVRMGDGTSPDSVLIMPPTSRTADLPSSIGAVRTAMLTGWAMDPSCRQRRGVDAVFPLSDHADFDELCCYAEHVGATMTYTVLGFDDELALHLRRRGVRAAPLRQPQQLSLL